MKSYDNQKFRVSPVGVLSGVCARVTSPLHVNSQTHSKTFKSEGIEETGKQIGEGVLAPSISAIRNTLERSDTQIGES